MTHTKRATPRYDIRLSAELRVEGRVITGTTKNLSLGGLCVEIDRPLQESSLVRLTLFVVEEDVETEGARGLELTGTVQWTAEGDRGYSIGVRFGTLNAAQQTALANALKAVGATES